VPLAVSFYIRLFVYERELAALALLLLLLLLLTADCCCCTLQRTDGSSRCNVASQHQMAMINQASFYLFQDTIYPKRKFDRNECFS